MTQLVARLQGYKNASEIGEFVVSFKDITDKLQDVDKTAEQIFEFLKKLGRIGRAGVAAMEELKDEDVPPIEPEEEVPEEPPV